MTPIIGLSEKRRVPRLGKIHLGIKVPTKDGKSEYPKAVDYFVCPPEVREVYGDEPKSLDVIIPTEDEEVFASTYYRAYSRTRGLVCKGDGQTADRLIDSSTKKLAVDEETGELITHGDIAKHDAKEVERAIVPCPARACPYYIDKSCKQLMMLQVLLPRVPGFGVYQIDTSSINSIIDINSQLALLRQIYGRVSGLPLRLTLDPREVSPDGKKKTVYTMHLRVDASMEEMYKIASSSQPFAALLAPPPDEKDMPELLYPDVEPEPQEATQPQPAAVGAKPDTEHMWSVEAWAKLLTWATSEKQGYKSEEQVLGALKGKTRQEAEAQYTTPKKAQAELLALKG